MLGTTVRGLKVHPDGLHFVYPLGYKVVVQNWKTKRQVFLSGHTNVVSAIAVSPDGKYIASGQINHMGFKVSMPMYYSLYCHESGQLSQFRGYRQLVSNLNRINPVHSKFP